jgi:hypothetical protein
VQPLSFGNFSIISSLYLSYKLVGIFTTYFQPSISSATFAHIFFTSEILFTLYSFLTGKLIFSHIFNSSAFALLVAIIVAAKTQATFFVVSKNSELPSFLSTHFFHDNISHIIITIKI